MSGHTCGINMFNHRGNSVELPFSLHRLLALCLYNDDLVLSSCLHHSPLTSCVHCSPAQGLKSSFRRCRYVNVSAYHLFFPSRPLQFVPWGLDTYRLTFVAVNHRSQADLCRLDSYIAGRLLSPGFLHPRLTSVASSLLMLTSVA